MLRLHLHQGSNDISEGEGDDHDANDLQDGGDGAREAGGEVVQHPRREKPDQKPRRNEQPGRCQHLHGESSEDGEVNGEPDKGGRVHGKSIEDGRVNGEPDQNGQVYGKSDQNDRVNEQQGGDRVE